MGWDDLKWPATLGIPAEFVWQELGYLHHMAVCQNLVPLVNIKIAGKWMFIPLKMVLIGIDPYPYRFTQHEMVKLETRVRVIGYWDDPDDPRTQPGSQSLHSQVKPPPHHNWNEAAWRKWRELVKPLVKDGKGYIYIYVVYGLTSYSFSGNWEKIGEGQWKGWLLFLRTFIDICNIL